MKIHELKIESKYYWEVIEGNKTFELRKDDRNYQVGDKIILLEYDKLNNQFKNKSSQYEITYKLNGGIYGLEEGYCILSIKEVGV